MWRHRTTARLEMYPQPTTTKGAICYFAFDKPGTLSCWAHNASRNGIFVRRSLDGGKTWETRNGAVSEYATAPVIRFEDKPYLVSSTTKSDMPEIYTWVGPDGL